MSTLIEDFRDLLHAAYARLFPHRIRTGSGRHHYRAQPIGRPAMVPAGGLTHRLGVERTDRDRDIASARRCAELLEAVRRGRSESVFYRGRLLALSTMRRVPARARFAGATAVGHMRTAAREASDAVAASTARLKGARHRHVPGTTDVGHLTVEKIMEHAKVYERQRARGERSWWEQGRRVATA